MDGAFSADESSGAIGAVARDAEGVFLMAMTRRLPAVASALAAEAEALRAGVQLIHTVTNGPVMLETDSLEVVALWNNRATQRSEFTPIFDDIQELASSFSFVLCMSNILPIWMPMLVLILLRLVPLKSGQMMLLVFFCRLCKMIVIMLMNE